MIKNDKEKAVAGVYWMGSMSVINIIIKLSITMILSRMLDPYEFGVVAAIQIVISFAEVFWMMGVGPAIVQKKELSNEDKITGNTLNIIFGVCIYIIIFIFSPIVASFIGIENIIMLRVLAIVFVIHSTSGVSESLLQKEMDFKSIGLINTTSLIAYGILASVLALFNYGAWALILAQLFQVSIKSLLAIIRKPIKISFQINKKSAKELMYFGMGFTLSKVFNSIALQGDYFVINKTIGSSSLGLYNRAYQLLMVPTNVIGAVMDQVLFPLLSKYQDINEKLRYVYVNITAIVSLISFPITIISLTMGVELVHIVLGKNWNLTVVPFKILVISLFFRMAYKICDSLVRSIGAVYKRLWIQIVYAFTIIAGAFIGKEWGINGVALAVTIAIILNYIIYTVVVMHMIKLKTTHLLNYLIPIIIVSGIIGCISYLISLLLLIYVSSILLRLIILTIIVALIYLFAFKYIIIKVLPYDFNEFVTSILNTTLSKVMPMKLKRIQ